MSVLNRTTGRLAKAAVVGALGAAIALGSTACGAGKISQTTNQLPAVNGAAGNIELAPTVVDGEELRNGQISVRNVQVVYPQADADSTFEGGGPFDIAFIVANDSVDHTVKLLTVEGPEGATVTPTTPTKPTDAPSDWDPYLIAPGASIVGGTPAQHLYRGESVANIEKDLDQTRLKYSITDENSNIRAGLTVPLTFTFEVFDLSGASQGTKSVTVEAPIDASNLNDRVDVVRDPQAHAEGEH